MVTLYIVNHVAMYKISFSILFVCILLSGCTTNNVDDTTTKVLTTSNYRAEVTYIEDSSWEYSIHGTVPTPCHSLAVDIVVAESYPEQVHLNVYISEPSEDVLCTQVLTEKTINGVFNASMDASVNLKEK